MRPFFSIGVTTYNRRDLLKEALSSVLGQTFADFEVIVGNDYTQEKLCGEMLGFTDPRIQFINHPQNLGELKNMNFLLATSRGRFFTWLADDDLYAPHFLESVHAAIIEHEFPPCVFTSYGRGSTTQNKLQTGMGESQAYRGSHFLQLYLSRELKAVGCYGVFERDYIQQCGGMQQLGDAFSPYSDNLLVIRAALLKKVVYINAPLVFYRIHEGSISYTSPDVRAFRCAQEDLCRQSIEVFGGEELREDFHTHLFLLLTWCVRDFITVACRSGSLGRAEAMAYGAFLNKYVRLLRGSVYYRRAWGMLVKGVLRLFRDMGKVRLNRWFLRSRNAV